jgi:hypothetical protein
MEVVWRGKRHLGVASLLHWLAVADRSFDPTPIADFLTRQTGG